MAYKQGSREFSHKIDTGNASFDDLNLANNNQETLTFDNQNHSSIKKVEEVMINISLNNKESQYQDINIPENKFSGFKSQTHQDE